MESEKIFSSNNDIFSKINLLYSSKLSCAERSVVKSHNFMKFVSFTKKESNDPSRDILLYIYKNIEEREKIISKIKKLKKKINLSFSILEIENNFYEENEDILETEKLMVYFLHCKEQFYGLKIMMNDKNLDLDYEKSIVSPRKIRRNRVNSDDEDSDNEVVKSPIRRKNNYK
jgi:hypothetical protein